MIPILGCAPEPVASTCKVYAGSCVPRPKKPALSNLITSVLTAVLSLVVLKTKAVGLSEPIFHVPSVIAAIDAPIARLSKLSLDPANDISPNVV